MYYCVTEQSMLNLILNENMSSLIIINYGEHVGNHDELLQ